MFPALPVPHNCPVTCATAWASKILVAISVRPPALLGGSEKTSEKEAWKLKTLFKREKLIFKFTVEIITLGNDRNIKCVAKPPHIYTSASIISQLQKNEIVNILCLPR